MNTNEFINLSNKCFASKHNVHHLISKMEDDSFFSDGIGLEWRKQTNSKITIKEQMIFSIKDQKHATKSLVVREGGREMAMGQEP